VKRSKRLMFETESAGSEPVSRQGPAAASRAADARPSSLFVVGAPRTGTTSLSKALASHPQICFSKPKETHFFLRPFGGESMEEVRRRYESAFFHGLNEHHRCVAEGSVSYLYDPQAIARILAFDPDAKFVVGLRNPLELLPSYHAQLLYTMDEDVQDFARAWALQGRRLRGEQIPPRCRDSRLLLYAEVGRLGSHLQRLIEVAGWERCFVYLFEEFRSEPLRIYKDILTFAGLPDDGKLEVRHKNRSRSFKSSRLQPFVMNPPAPLARMIGLFSDRGHARLRSMVRPLRRRLKRMNSAPAARAPLPPELRQELRDYYRQDVLALERLLQRELGWLR
jgi:hypothetical protein